MTEPGTDLIRAAGELLGAVAKLTDDELCELNTCAWRFASGFTEEPPQPRIADVMHRAGVLLAEETDRRRDILEHARQQHLRRADDRPCCGCRRRSRPPVHPDS
jgi:hypothetical protein